MGEEAEGIRVKPCRLRGELGCWREAYQPRGAGTIDTVH